MYEALAKQFKPIMKINLTEGKNIFPVTSFTKLPGRIKYIAKGHTDEKLLIRTYYDLLKTQNSCAILPFLVTTGTGQIVEIKNINYEFSMQNNVQTKLSKIEHITSLHNGPISVCHLHPEIDNFILIIGGSVYSIYNTDILQTVYSKKAPGNSKYLSGGWLQKYVSCFVLLRSDGAVEIWDLLQSTVKPLRIYTGRTAKNLFGTLAPPHCRNDTIGISDIIGDLWVLNIPQIKTLNCKDDISSTKKLFENAVKRKDLLNKWMQRFEGLDSDTAVLIVKKPSGIVNYEIEPGDRKNVEVKISEIEKMNRIFDVEWETQELKDKFKALLELHNYNLEELQKNEELVQSKIRDKKKIESKQHDIIAYKEIIFDNAKVLLLPQPPIERTRTYCVAKSAESADFAFKADYDRIEETALMFIQENEYKFTGNSFTRQLNLAKKRRTLFNNISERRRKRRTFENDPLN